MTAPFYTYAFDCSLGGLGGRGCRGVPGDTIAEPVDVQTLGLGGCSALTTIPFDHVPFTNGIEYIELESQRWA